MVTTLAFALAISLAETLPESLESRVARADREVKFAVLRETGLDLSKYGIRIVLDSDLCDQKCSGSVACIYSWHGYRKRKLFGIIPERRAVPTIFLHAGYFEFAPDRVLHLVLAHEYGHYVDGVLLERWKNEIQLDTPSDRYLTAWQGQYRADTLPLVVFGPDLFLAAEVDYFAYQRVFRTDVEIRLVSEQDREFADVVWRSSFAAAREQAHFMLMRALKEELSLRSDIATFLHVSGVGK